MRRSMLTVCGLSFLLIACDGDWAEGMDRHSEPFEYTYSLAPDGRVSVENMNGSVEIKGWDRDTVEVTGVKYARSEDSLRALKIDIQQGPDYIRVRTVPPSGPRRGGMGARYTISVPRRAELDRIVSSNGRVEVRDVDGPARLRTSNGAVRAMNTKGVLEIETSNGGIDIVDHHGAVTGRTSNGRIQAELSDPEQGRPIRFESSNGGITLRLRALNGNNVRLSTSNASINLALPGNAGAQLRADTSNGQIRSDLPLQGSISKRTAEGRIGAGGPQLELSTSNGSINLERL
jgi:Putative adhesin